MRKALGLVGALVSVSALLVGGAALANGGGGGGGGMAPSMSAPRYDPAEEYRKGIAALQAQRFAEAKKAFDRVLAVAPKDANTNYLAGMARAGLDDWKGAKKFYEKAVKYDADLVMAQRELGVALAKLGDMPKAQAQLDLLNQRSASCAGTCAQAADLNAAVAAVKSALGQPTARLDVRPELIFASAEAGDRAYLSAVSLINARRYEEAIIALGDAERAFGPHPDVLTYLGFANRKLKRFDVAEGYYGRALAAAPGHRGATEYYGELMVERGDIAGAKKKLAELEAQCAFGCVEAEELRGWIAAGGSPAS